MIFVVFGYSMLMFGIVLNGFHLLVCLLMLEGMMLMIVMVIGWGVSGGMSSNLSLLIFMYVMVCEGVMGLVLLTGMVQDSWSDKFYYYSIF